MRTIVHLSDLHFGHIDPEIVEALGRHVCEIAPDLVAVSGDLTQRARPQEFQAARAFLDHLPYPRIVVPGNHDVPLYNLFARWRRPLAEFRRWISEDLAPFYADSELAILGVNTARSLTWKGGRINRDQVERACRRFDEAPPHSTRIIVTHHPLDLPEPLRPHHLVGRAQMALAGFAACHVDLFLAGHLHTSYSGGGAYGILIHPALIIQAGTATSTRTRGGELNSFNLVQIDCPLVAVEFFTWDCEERRFLPRTKARFERGEQGWARAA